MKKTFLITLFLITFSLIFTIFSIVTRPPTHSLFKRSTNERTLEQIATLKNRSIESKKTPPKNYSALQISPIPPQKNDIITTLSTVSIKKPTATKTITRIPKNNFLKILPLIKDTTRTALSGTIKTLTLSNMDWSAKQSIALDIQQYPLTSLAMRWGKGRLYYSFSSTNKLEEAWQELKPNSEGPVPEDYIVSEMIFPPQKAKYLLIKSDVSLKTWQLDIINVSAKDISPSSGKLAVKGIYNRNSGAQYSSLNIITRDQWGANPASWDTGVYKDKNIDDPQRFVWNPEYYRASRIIVHHTVSSNAPANSTVVVRAIYLYHSYSLGWGDIGYNYLIDNKGNIYEGKGGGDETQGYHAYLQANTMSVGIGMIGNFTYRLPTVAARTSLKKLMAEKAAFYNFDLKYNGGSLAQWKNTTSTVFGHRDSWLWCHSKHPLSYLCKDKDKWIINATACPGNKFHPVLKQLTQEAQAYKKANFKNIKRVVKTVNSLLAGQHPSNKFLVVYNLPKETVATNIKSLVPAFSGISKYEIFDNIVIYSVFDWNNGGIVPPVGWSGFYPNTFFPVSNGPEDRIRTLMKIFSLDPQVKFVSFAFQGKFAR